MLNRIRIPSWYWYPYRSQLTRLCSVLSLSSAGWRRNTTAPLNFGTKIKLGFITQGSGTDCAKQNPLYIGLGTASTILYVHMGPFVCKAKTLGLDHDKYQDRLTSYSYLYVLRYPVLFYNYSFSWRWSTMPVRPRPCCPSLWTSTARMFNLVPHFR